MTTVVIKASIPDGAPREPSIERCERVAAAQKHSATLHIQWIAPKARVKN
jgi:hypothetical protein